MNNEKEKIPVRHNDTVVGYTTDNGKSIEYNDTAAANEVKNLLKQNQVIGISSRAINEKKL